MEEQSYGGEDGKDGEREERWVWRKKVDMEKKVGMGEKRWQKEERSHAGRRWA